MKKPNSDKFWEHIKKRSITAGKKIVANNIYGYLLMSVIILSPNKTF